MRTRKLVAWLVGVCLLTSAVAAPLASGPAQAASKAPVTEQIVTDLVGAGISIAAAATGNVPLAFMAGFLTKYVSTYGIQGVRAVVDYFKGYTPRDLGEINLYSVYLMTVKRNLYQAMIQVRKAVQADESLGNLEAELARIEGVLAGQCKLENGCAPTGLDPSLVSYAFLNIVLDARQSIDVSRQLGANEIKNTYQYLVLLYLDVIIVEQKLVEAQYDVLASRTAATLELLKDNPYLSNAEKEMQGQLLANLALRWMQLADTRRVILAQALREPVRVLRAENDALQREIDEYRRRGKSPEKSDDGAPPPASDSYETYMRRIQNELREAGTQVDAFSQNPFQTGTALSGYFLGEKTLLLERDAFFQMKANKLETTEEVADFQHRSRVLRAHANNMLLQLLLAVEQRNKDGFSAVEAPKHKEDLEKLIAECEKDAKCVADRLANPETSLSNILVDNFALAAQVFGQIPYMHALELNAAYQLVQLMYLEVFHSEALLSSKEFGIFLGKQKALEKTIRKNRSLSPSERELHTAMVTNTLNKWKKRILERKHDHADSFKARALEIQARNRELFGRVSKLRSENAALFGRVYDEKEHCFNLFDFKKWRWCKARKQTLRAVRMAAEGSMGFLGSKEAELPEEFWEGI